MPRPPQENFRLNRDSVQANGLVFWAPMYHPFNAHQNLILHDLSLYQQRLSIISPATPSHGVSDIFGNTNRYSSTVDVAEGYFELPRAPYLEDFVEEGCFGFSAWVNVLQLGVATTPALIVRDDVSNGIRWGNTPGGGGGMFIEVFDTDADNLSTLIQTTAVPSGWCHVAASRGRGLLKHWINGRSGQTSDATVDDPLEIDAAWRILGTDHAGCCSWANPVADLRIYNRELTDGIVRHMFNAATRFDLCEAC